MSIKNKANKQKKSNFYLKEGCYTKVSNFVQLESNNYQLKYQFQKLIKDHVLKKIFWLNSNKNKFFL